MDKHTLLAQQKDLTKIRDTIMHGIAIRFKVGELKDEIVYLIQEKIDHVDQALADILAAERREQAKAKEKEEYKAKCAQVIRLLQVAAPIANVSTFQTIEEMLGYYGKRLASGMQHNHVFLKRMRDDAWQLLDQARWIRGRDAIKNGDAGEHNPAVAAAEILWCVSDNRLDRAEEIARDYSNQ